MDSVTQVTNYAKKTVEFIDNNKILSSILGLLLVLYAALAAPKLPKNVAKVFDNPLFKLGYMFLMAYLVTKDPSVAIISSVALFLTIQTLASYEVANKAVEVVKQTTLVNNEQVGNTVAIPLTPTRAEFLEACAKSADLHYREANKAEQEGNMVLAEAHKQQAMKEEVKMDGTIKAKQHLLAAEEAEKKGNVELANVHKIEAEKQEAKVEAFVNAEVHMEASVKAEQEGRQEEAQALAEMAKAEEMRAKTLVQAETEEIRAQTLERAENDQTVDEVVVESKPETVQTEPEVTDTKNRCGGEFELEGYEGSDYATF